MKRLPALLVAALAVVALAGAAVAAPPESKRFVAPLSGDEEVPAVDTDATGNTVLKLDEDEGALAFRLIASNIDGVTQSHIHCGTPGVNGPVVVFLFGFVSPGVSSDGILAEGTRTGADVIARPDSPACPGGVADFDDLVEKLRTGGAYVNVHTEAHPGGEIRGAVREAGAS